MNSARIIFTFQKFLPSPYSEMWRINSGHEISERARRHVPEGKTLHSLNCDNLYAEVKLLNRRIFIKILSSILLFKGNYFNNIME